MLELVAIIILFSSLMGMSVIIIKKIPVLSSLSLPEQVESLPFWQKIKNKISDIPWLKNFSLEKFLQKRLSKLKILVLKTESKIEKYLQQLRKRSRDQKENTSDSYWQKLKEAKNDPEEKF